MSSSRFVFYALQEAQHKLFSYLWIAGTQRNENEHETHYSLRVCIGIKRQIHSSLHLVPCYPEVSFHFACAGSCHHWILFSGAGQKSQAFFTQALTLRVWGLGFWVHENSLSPLAEGRWRRRACSSKGRRGGSTEKGIAGRLCVPSMSHEL